MLYGQKLNSQNIQVTGKGSDQTAHTRRLVWAFAGHTYHIFGNLMLWLCFDPDQADKKSGLIWIQTVWLDNWSCLTQPYYILIGQSS